MADRGLVVLRATIKTRERNSDGEVKLLAAATQLSNLSRSPPPFLVRMRSRAGRGGRVGSLVLRVPVDQPGNSTPPALERSSVWSPPQRCTEAKVQDLGSVVDFILKRRRVREVNLLGCRGGRVGSLDLIPPSVAGLGKTMEQNDRYPFPRFHIVLADIVGVDRVMLDHDRVLSRGISTAGQRIAAKARDRCSGGVATHVTARNASGSRLPVRLATIRDRNVEAIQSY